MPRERENLSQNHSNEDQILILEYTQRPKSGIRLADRIWCLRRLVLRNYSPFPIDVLTMVVGEDFFFLQEDVQAEMGHGSRIVRPLNSQGIEAKVMSKVRTTIPSNQSKLVSFMIP